MDLSDAELKTEQRKVVLWSAAALACSTVVLFGSYSLLPGWFEFPSQLAQRIAFTLQVDLFIFAWVVFGLRQVAKIRFRSAADNRGSAFGPPSPRLAVSAAFLQNTLEQAVTAVGAHLALATLVTGSSLALIIGATVLFGIGRVTFLLGYPHGAGGRAFGMATTAIPTAAAYVWAIGLVFLEIVHRWPFQ